MHFAISLTSMKMQEIKSEQEWLCPCACNDPKKKDCCKKYKKGKRCKKCPSD